MFYFFKVSFSVYVVETIFFSAEMWDLELLNFGEGENILVTNNFNLALLKEYK